MLDSAKPLWESSKGFILPNLNTYEHGKLEKGKCCIGKALIAIIKARLFLKLWRKYG